MKFGISTYSLHQAFNSGKFTLDDVIDAIANIGAEHVEIVPIGYNLVEQPELIDTILSAAKRNNLELSSYAIPANFSDLTEEAVQNELERVKKEVDVCAKLGITRMRHDIAKSTDTSIDHFLKELPLFIQVCSEISQYAEQYGITTSIENHGFYVQHTDRVQAIVKGVNRSNFKTTVDIGNFLCADEAPEIAVAKNIPLASMVHVKDFYIRPAILEYGAGWFKSTGGTLLRGAMFGYGDINVMDVLKTIKNSDYDDYISLEFEGMEECVLGTTYGFEFLKNAWKSL